MSVKTRNNFTSRKQIKKDLVLRCSRAKVFYKKGVLRTFEKFTGKHLCQSLFFNKVAGPRPATLSKKRLWHRCFLVNVAKFQTILFLKEHLRWLLLGSETFSYLREKNEEEVTVRKEELEIRKRKIERQRFNKQMQRVLINQQKQTTQLIQQQQQISIAVLNFMKKFTLSSQCCCFSCKKRSFKAPIIITFLKNYTYQMPQTLLDVVVLKSLAILNKKPRSKIGPQGGD